MNNYKEEIKELKKIAKKSKFINFNSTKDWTIIFSFSLQWFKDIRNIKSLIKSFWLFINAYNNINKKIITDIANSSNKEKFLLSKEKYWKLNKFISEIILLLPYIIS